MSAIDNAPRKPDAIPADAIPAEHLGRLNAAMYLAQLRISEAREIEARLMLARIEAERAGEAFRALRAEVSRVLGVALGETHGWDQATGEVREVRGH